MNRILILAVMVSFGLAMSSCRDASFTEVTPLTPPSDFWYTAEPVLHLTGEIHDDGNKLPPNPKIIVAWEMPNSSVRLLYVYGVGTVTKSTHGGDRSTFDVTLRDTLPKFVLTGMDTGKAIAAGHIFLIDGASIIKEGDTLLYSLDWSNSYHMLGSMTGEGIIFLKGSPTLLNQATTAIPAGFNRLRAKRVDPFAPSGPKVTEFENPDSSIEIEMDYSGKGCKDQTPFWLQ